MSISSIRRISPLIKGNYGDYRFVGLSDNEKDFIVSSKLMDIVSTLSVGNTVEYEVGVGKTGKPRLVSLNPVIPDSNTMENKPFPVAGTSDSKAYRDDRLVPMLVSYAKDLCPPAPSWEEAVSRVCHMYEYITQFLSEGSTEVVNVESKRPNNLKISKLQIDRILELSKKLGMTNDEQNGISSLLSAYIKSRFGKSELTYSKANQLLETLEDCINGKLKLAFDPDGSVQFQQSVKQVEQSEVKLPT